MSVQYRFYFIIQVPVMLVLALGLAQLLNNPKIKGKGIFRTLIFCPVQHHWYPIR